MIRYDLVCNQGHAFDAWFRDSGGFDEQSKSGFLTCPHCNSPKVSKAIMAPRVARTETQAQANETPDLAGGMPAMVRQAMRELRARMTEGSQDVGVAFPEQARRMHRGEIPSKPVYGNASPREVKALIEEGVPVAPLPPEPGGH